VGCAVAALLVAGLTGGCGLGKGAKASGGTTVAPDSSAALRQDVDRLRAELAELRARVEADQRVGTEHADRVAQETRAEFVAVQRSIEATARHDFQRQVEVLDAQAKRIDLLDRRATELGQALRRVELGLSGIETQLARVLDAASAPVARAGSPVRSPAAPPASRPATAATPAASAAESDAPAAAGAGLTPPAMLGSPAPPAAKRTDAPREAKATPPARPAQEEPAREAKAAPPAADAKPAAPERPTGATPPRPAKAGTFPGPPAAGSATARALFDRAMENWNRGEQGQAVLEFEELIQAFPSDPLAAAAQFRIGEAYYTARDFERAALEYRKAVELAPKGKDTPRALLRLGLAYRAQKREVDARQAWSQLIRDFPESDATEEARRALRGR
jgi:tol-pal system protein YbgF